MPSDWLAWVIIVVTNRWQCFLKCVISTNATQRKAKSKTLELKIKDWLCDQVLAGILILTWITVSRSLLFLRLLVTDTEIKTGLIAT